MKKDYFKLILMGWLYVLTAELACFMFAVMTMAYYKYIVILIAGILASFFIFGGLIFTYASGVALKDKKTQDVFNTPRCFLLSLYVTLPSVILYILLLLFNAGIIGGFDPIFRITNAHLIPVLYLMSEYTENIYANTHFMIVLGILSFFPAVTAYLSYLLTFKNENILSSILYQQKK